MHCPTNVQRHRSSIYPFASSPLPISDPIKARSLLPDELQHVLHHLERHRHVPRCQGPFRARTDRGHEDRVQCSEHHVFVGLEERGVRHRWIPSSTKLPCCAEVQAPVVYGQHLIRSKQGLRHANLPSALPSNSLPREKFKLHGQSTTR